MVQIWEEENVISVYVDFVLRSSSERHFICSRYS
jgi:hypothetical protein